MTRMTTTTDHEKLAGWLCMWRLQHGSSNGGVCCIPAFVRREWRRLGWVEFDGKPDEDGLLGCALTDAGKAVTDLHGPDWGIDPLDAG